MAGSKEIRNKIKSVQSTRKITKAMEMVSASKMKKAQDRMRASRPYVMRALQIAMHVAKANTEYKHPFLVAARRRPARRRDRRDHRQGALRRTQHQHPAPRAEPAQGVAGEGNRGRLLRDRQQGLRVPQPPGREHRLACGAAGRPAAPRPADRAGQAPARQVHGRRARRGAHLLHDVREHDAAGVAPRPDAADPRGVPCARRGRRGTEGGGLGRARGTTSTSPTRRRCSTACCGATSRRSSSRW